MNPVKTYGHDGPVYNNLITDTGHLDLLLEWANAKLEILNLTTKKPNFTTEFTWDIISTYGNGLFIEQVLSTGPQIGPIIESITRIDSDYSISSPGTATHIGYLNNLKRVYGLTDFHWGTNVTFSKMNRLFMDGTTYDSWNSVVSNSKLYSEETPQFSTDTSLIYGSSSNT